MQALLSRACLVILLVLIARVSDAATYLLFKVTSIEGVPQARWLYTYGVWPQPSRYPEGYEMPNSRVHLRLESGFDLLRIRHQRRIVLRHLDFTEYWAGLAYPDRKLSRELELELRPGAIHFIGELEVGKDQTASVWRADLLAEACEKFPVEMREHRFIVVRPLADNDLEIEDPCNEDQFVVRELR